MTGERYVSLVTGASRGIGAAIVERLASAGHEVIGIARRKPETSAAQHFFEADLRDRRAVDQVLAEITRRFDVDHLVNNAGMTNPAPIEKVSLDKLQEVLDLNVRAAIQCVQAVLPHMRRRRRGRIVNISSRAVLGKVERTSYVASKGGLIAMARVWAMELAADGITVNCVAPGPIATELFRRNHPADDPATIKLEQLVPMKRWGRPEEVAAAVAFFLSDDASYITGQTLFVCGGVSVTHAPW